MSARQPQQRKSPPKDEDYGGRNYSARDPDGHVWSFGSYDPWEKRAGA